MFRQMGGKLLPTHARGAQGASAAGAGHRDPADTVAARPSRRASAGRILTSLIGVIVVLTSQAALGTGAAVAADAAAPLAVIIVGPSSSMTSQNLKDGAAIARQAEDAGMRVRKVFHPRATWENVLAAIQGASFVVYMGHGNGWPSPHGPFQEDTKDGFGLDPQLGSSAYAADYYGADKLRKRVHLAKDAVVLLEHLCYASGNGEESMGPEFDKGLATKRADNFASGFLDVGARAVFAYGVDQRIDLPNALMHGDRTMDEIFESPNTDNQYDGFVGKADYYRDSVRTGWARLHMDPHPKQGHYRAVTGDLGMTASEFRAGAGDSGTPAPDTTAPVLKVQRNGADLATAGAAVQFSPNGDGTHDALHIRRTLTERATIRVEVRNRNDKLVRAFSRVGRRGTGTITWDGRDNGGRIVRDGTYRLSLTPRDKAGNRGVTRTVSAQVLTSLKSLSLSRRSILAADRDRFAPSTRLAFTLTRTAHVSWVIRDASGRTVVTHIGDRKLSAGRHAWVWNGRDQKGRFVSPGAYSAVITVRTAAGSIRVTRAITVGAFRIATSDPTPSRGQRIRIRVYSTEPLKHAPTIHISQGGHDRVVTTRRVGAAFVATVRLRSDGKAGTLHIRAVGIDKGGQRQGFTQTLPLH